MTAIPRVMISHKVFAHLIHTNIRNFRHCGGVFGVFFWEGGRGNYMFSYGFCDWIQLEINCAKLNCIMLEALTSYM